MVNEHLSRGARRITTFEVVEAFKLMTRHEADADRSLMTSLLDAATLSLGPRIIAQAVAD